MSYHTENSREEPKRRLSVTASGQGKIQPAPGVYSFKPGECIKIVAKADPGWRFDRWSGDLSGNQAQKNIVVTRNKRVTANFIPLHKLTISLQGRGATRPNPGTYSYSYGERVYVSALADAGWKLDCWSGDVSGRDSTRAINLISDLEVVARFKPVNERRPVSYLANRRSREIHISDCRWVSKMSERNKLPLSGLNEVYERVRDSRYNGCFYCLSRYDRDTLNYETVIRNLESDIHSRRQAERLAE